MKPNLIEMQSPWLRKSAEVSPRKSRKHLVSTAESKSSSARRTILLITEDRQLHENLRELANTRGDLVIRAKGPIGSLAILQVVRPVVVLLDLDLPRQAAWETADTPAQASVAQTSHFFIAVPLCIYYLQIRPFTLAGTLQG